MVSRPTYPAERAANVVLGMTVLAAVICGVAGVSQLRQGSSLGWLLIAVGLLPLVAAVLIRRSVGRSAR